jgi:hypothetical protein
MSITQHNYAIYFIDYYEGKLSESKTRELMIFLAANPDLKKEFEDYHNEPLIPDLDITFEDKSTLKKQEFVLAKETEDEIISYMEGDLPGEMMAGMQNELEKDEIKKKAYTQYKATILTPDTNLEFPYKADLKKKASVSLFSTRWTTYAAAAVIILLIGVSGLLIFNSGSSNTRDLYVLNNLGQLEVININNTLITRNIATRTPVQMTAQTYTRDHITISKARTLGANEVIASSSYSGSELAQQYRIIYPSYQLMWDDNSSALAEAQKDKTAAGRIISGLFGRFKSSADNRNENIASTNSNKFSLWNIAEIGVKGMNALGDHEYTLVREYNENGNVKGVIILEE